MDSVLAAYHNRISDDAVGNEPPALRTRQNLEKLRGIALEEFSSADYPALDQEIIISTLARVENKFKHLDLSNLKVTNTSSTLQSVLISSSYAQMSYLKIT